MIKRVTNDLGVSAVCGMLLVLHLSKLGFGGWHNFRATIFFMFLSLDAEKKR